jgi:hypothetical protein
MKCASFRLPASLIILLSCILVSCSKDKYTTKPQISIVSINTQVPVNGVLNVTLQVTSKKGDLGGGYFVAIRNRLNQDPLLPGTGNTDTLSGVIPTYPDQSKSEFLFSADWQTLHESNTSENDTIIMKFAAIDANMNSSDTIVSPMIVVYSQ